MSSHMQTIKNVYVPNAVLDDPNSFGGTAYAQGRVGDLTINDQGHIRLIPSARAANTSIVILPKLTEAHVHLDKCHSSDRIGGIGGDLLAAIDAQHQDKANWTDDDIRDRAARGLSELVAAGCGTVRTHVDWSYGTEASTPPPAWHVLTDLATEQKSKLHLQVAPLVGADVMADTNVAESIAKIIATKNGILGLFVLYQPDRRAGIEAAFKMAAKFNLPLDFHVDEGLDPFLNGLEMIADTALETKFDRPILCGHACSLAVLPDEDFKRITDKLAQAGITITTLPTTNLYLQGRNGRTPTQRGLTRIADLQAAGVPVIFGTDNVRDAFFPLGAHDPMQTLAVANMAAHLDPPFEAHLPMITSNAQRALGLEPIWVDRAPVSDLLIYQTGSLAEAISQHQKPNPLSDHIIGELQ